MNSFRHQYMVVHLDDEFFPLLEKALKPYNQYEECKTDQWDGVNYTSEDHPDRSSKACWVDDHKIYELMDGLIAFANSKRPSRNHPANGVLKPDFFFKIS